jgi:hypothetical protein
MDAVEEGRRECQVRHSLQNSRTSARIASVTTDIQMYMISVSQNECILETVTDANIKELENTEGGHQVVNGNTDFIILAASSVLVTIIGRNRRKMGGRKEGRRKEGRRKEGTVFIMLRREEIGGTTHSSPP